MAYNGRYTSIKRVVEKAYRDAGLDKVEWETAIEWTVDFMGLIGIPYQYINKSTNGQGDNPLPVFIENYRGILPPELVNIISCRRIKLDPNGIVSDFYPMVESTDIFHTTETNRNNQSISTFNPVVKTVSFDLDDDGDITSTQSQTEQDSIQPRPNKSYQYKVQGEYIFTDFKDGYVEVSYTGYPLDTEGFPMIPEDPKYLKALEFYIISNLDWKNWRKNPTNQNRAIMLDSEQKADWYIGAARTKSHIPSIDKMESIKNQWLRSIPKINEHSNNFKSMNSPEVRYNNFPTKRY